jgi:glycosyltransferase involved in cell wall biosynthesis
MPAMNTLLKSLRIAVVSETYPPEVNGVAMSLARLVAGLQERGHRLQLLRPRQLHEPAQTTASPLEEVLMPSWPIPHYPQLRMGVPSRRRLQALWTTARPDLVHIATEGPLGWSALQAARALRIPVSSDFRTNFHSYGRHYGMGWLTQPILAYLRHFHNRTQATMVPTEALRNTLQRQGFERLHVVGRGVDTTLFSPSRRSAALRASWGVADDTLVLACVGRLAAEKNLSVVLRAFDAVRHTHPSARLLLVGDGPMRAELQAACPQAIFAGHRSGDALAAHYASADVFVFASLTETFGNVTTEAMASGLPVVAYRHAAAGQLIQSGLNGMLAISESADDFVDATLRLVNNRHWRCAVGRAARETALGIAWGRVVAAFEAVAAPLIDAPVLEEEAPWALPTQAHVMQASSALLTVGPVSSPSESRITS